MPITYFLFCHYYAGPVGEMPVVSDKPGEANETLDKPTSESFKTTSFLPASEMREARKRRNSDSKIAARTDSFDAKSSGSWKKRPDKKQDVGEEEDSHVQDDGKEKMKIKDKREDSLNGEKNIDRAKRREDTSPERVPENQMLPKTVKITKDKNVKVESVEVSVGCDTSGLDATTHMEMGVQAEMSVQTETGVQADRRPPAKVKVDKCIQTGELDCQLSNYVILKDQGVQADKPQETIVYPVPLSKSVQCEPCVQQSDLTKSLTTKLCSVSPSPCDIIADGSTSRTSISESASLGSDKPLEKIVGRSNRSYHNISHSVGEAHIPGLRKEPVVELVRQPTIDQMKPGQSKKHVDCQLVEQGSIKVQKQKCGRRVGPGRPPSRWRQRERGRCLAMASEQEEDIAHVSVIKRTPEKKSSAEGAAALSFDKKGFSQSNKQGMPGDHSSKEKLMPYICPILNVPTSQSSQSESLSHCKTNSYATSDITKQNDVEVVQSSDPGPAKTTCDSDTPTNNPISSQAESTVPISTNSGENCSKAFAVELPKQMTNSASCSDSGSLRKETADPLIENNNNNRETISNKCSSSLDTDFIEIIDNEDNCVDCEEMKNTKKAKSRTCSKDHQVAPEPESTEVSLSVQGHASSRKESDDHIDAKRTKPGRQGKSKRKKKKILEDLDKIQTGADQEELKTDACSSSRADCASKGDESTAPKPKVKDPIVATINAVIEATMEASHRYDGDRAFFQSTTHMSDMDGSQSDRVILSRGTVHSDYEPLPEQCKKKRKHSGQDDMSDSRKKRRKHKSKDRHLKT